MTMEHVDKIERCPNCQSKSLSFGKVRYVTNEGLTEFYEWRCHACRTKVTIPVDELIPVTVEDPEVY